MENPWASPWATAESDSVTKPKTAAVASPEPPPAAFFSSTPSNISLPPSHSPWTEDESFGDWAAPEPTPSAAPSGWGIWGSGDAAPADGHLTPRLDRRRKGSNPQWPNSRATSPGLRPPPLSKRSSSDHLVLDPWASEPSFNRSNDAELHIQHLPSLPTASHDDDFVQPPLRSRASNISIVVEPQSPIPTSQDDGQDSTISATPDADPPAAQQDSTASPASSVSEAGGIPDNAHPDSPITPAEEAPSAEDREKSSSKVHQLVSMYDGIARKSSFVPELVPGPKRAVSQESTSRESMGTPAPRSVTSTPALPAGDDQIQIRKTRKPVVAEEDTESLVSEDEDVPSPAVDIINPPEPVIEPASEPLPAPASVSASEHDEEASADETRDAPDTIHHEPFMVDLENLDKLFTGPKSHVTGDDVTVPDRIITDSFEAISERKTWYRISRYGPMRQHNAGNDENYARINWASSSIHPEIITTVRRWMEEDSMGGRPYRGALSKGAGGPAFGWNQPSTPVSLEEFFRRGRSGRGTPEQNPRQSMSSLPPPANIAAVEQRPVSMPPGQASTTNAWSGLASFGWASEAPTQPASPGNPAPGAVRNAAPPEDKTFKLQAAPKKSQSPAPPLQKVEHDESDDEWGDMVTPSVPDFPSKPAGFGWETATEVKQPDPLPPIANGFGATTSTPQVKSLPFSGWNDAPLVPTTAPPIGTPPKDVMRADSKENIHPRKTEESPALVEVNPKSKPRKKVAFGQEVSPISADSDTAADAAVAREFISKLPDLSYMLR